MPTADCASELLARRKRVNRFLSWAAQLAGDSQNEAERIATFVSAVWHAQCASREGVRGFEVPFTRLLEAVTVAERAVRIEASRARRFVIPHVGPGALEDQGRRQAARDRGTLAAMEGGGRIVFAGVHDADRQLG